MIPTLKIGMGIKGLRLAEPNKPIRPYRSDKPVKKPILTHPKRVPSLPALREIERGGASVFFLTSSI